MTTLVTGATGLIGTHLVSELKKEEKVICYAHTPPIGQFQKEALDGTVVINGDIRDYRSLKRVMSRYYVDKVYHLAALAEVKSAFKDPIGVYDVNVMGCVKVLEAARTVGVDKTLVLITDKVYGEKLGAVETDVLHASEPYGTSKVCQQYICQSYAETYGMHIVTPHSCNVFGYDPYSNRIFPNVIKKCLKGDAPRIWANDKSIREYIYTEDVVSALMYCMGYYTGSINISTGWVHDNKNIVEEIAKHFDLTPILTYPENIPTQIQEQTMSSDRYNFIPAWSFEDAVERTVADFIKYQEDLK